MTRKKRWLLGLIILIVAAGTSIYFLKFQEQKQVVIETVTADIGQISNTITATGTLEAIITVQVGTQVSGVIEKINVDFNSHVKKGDLLAVIDNSILLSNLQGSEANLNQMQAKYEYENSNFERVSVLYKKELISDTEYDLAKYNYKSSKANLLSAQSNYDKSEINLSYANIYSPIDGVVLNRAVDEGQTVASSFNTPELFSIAQDLTQMEVQADIDEADIGNVEAGQRVEFTVDAFPDLMFLGSVREVRLEPVETSNVVTYTVIIDAPNNDLKLKPGMTASITNYVEEITDVLVLSGKAFRFTPDRELIMSYMQEQMEANGKKQGSRPQRGEKGQNSAGKNRGEGQQELADNMKRIWIKQGEMIRPQLVEIGSDDGTNVEIISGLKQGDEVVISMKISETKIETESSTTTQNPFVQQRPGRK